jgi:hypothetical protein
VVPFQDDPGFQTIVPGTEVAQRLAESGSSIVAGYVRNAAGTRTLVRLVGGYTPPAGGDTLTIELVRPASTQLDLPAENATLLTVKLGPKAPWED